MLHCLAVGAGGFIGSILRYLIGLIPLNESTIFPYKTLFINLLGSFFIGLLAAWGLKHHPNPSLTLFLKVGLCGGFTTFSTFALESVQLLQTEKYFSAFLYIVLSIGLSLSALYAAQGLVK